MKKKDTAKKIINNFISLPQKQYRYGPSFSPPSSAVVDCVSRCVGIVVDVELLRQGGCSILRGESMAQTNGVEVQTCD